MPRTYVPRPASTQLLLSLGAAEREVHDLGNHWPNDPRQVTAHLMRILSSLADARSSAREIEAVHVHWRDRLQQPQPDHEPNQNGRTITCPNT